MSQQLSTRRACGRCPRPAVSSRCKARGASMGRVAAGAMIFELDAVAVDLHMDGHRKAFNAAFCDFGFDCAHFTPHVYNDLLQQSDGRADSMVHQYFDVVGWPLTVATSEKDLFVSKIVGSKEHMLARMLKKNEVPLRPGFAEVLQAAVDSGAVVAAVAGTLSSSEHDVTGSVLRLLDPSLAQHVRVFSSGANQPPSEAQEAPPSLDQALSEATARVKQAEAARFVEALGELSAGKPGMASVVLEPSLGAQGAAAPSGGVSPQWFLAVSAALGVPIASCCVLVGTAATCMAASAAGAAPVAIPRKLAKGAAFPGSVGKFDDMGMGGATWQRMCTLLDAPRQ